MSEATYDLIRYLASKYNVPITGIRKCLKEAAQMHLTSTTNVLDVVYEICSEVKVECHASHIGGRPQNEDTHVIEKLVVDKLGSVIMAGVFDGHGGSEVSKILAANLGKYLEQRLNMELVSNSAPVISRILVQSIIDFDEDLRGKTTQGSTLTLVLITRDKIFSVNLGDSRTVIFTKKGEIVFETKDHKPSDPMERRRIELAGGIVVGWGVPRVNGNLSLSRAVGDFSEIDKPLGKPYSISNIPDVRSVDRNQPVSILLACDGIWDVYTTQEAVQFLLRGVEGERSVSRCDRLIEVSLGRGSTDNQTVLLLEA
jgi:serine/threonine protein phosphatase PrpC